MKDMVHGRGQRHRWLEVSLAEMAQLMDDICNATDEGRSDYEWVVVGYQRRDCDEEGPEEGEAH
jgi:hypothetical protein